MNKPYLRIFGDIHDKLYQYIPLALEAEHTIQLGDLGFEYEDMALLDPIKHRVLGGNHDDYAIRDGVFYNQTPHFLGDYGVHSVPGVGDFFFLRGGHSIDKNERTEGFDWFPDEQISYANGMKALEAYSLAKPELMLSHECPTFIIDMIAGFKTWNGEPIRPSMTANLLEQMFNEHKPMLHLFAHHHQHFDMTIEGTRFICLPELAYLDFNKKEEAK